MSSNIVENGVSNKTVSKKILNKTWFQWICFGQICYNYERMMGLGFTHAMSYTLEELYKDNKEELSNALSRHLTFYNTENTWGSIILGIVASLEEEKANGKSVDADGISGLKTALMGPMAGIGDSITQALVKVILLALAVDFALQGNPIGVIIFVLGFSAYALIVSKFMFNAGYRLGRNSVVQLLQGEKVKSVTKSLGAIGMMVLGALVANNLNLTTPLNFKIGEVVTQVQPMLDSIFPKLLNVVAFLLVYWLLKKGKKTNTIILIIFAAAIVLSLFKLM